MNERQAKATLLCVDDEPNILSALRRVFRPQGYRILVAGSGADGLEILKQKPVDLVISDMRMPSMNGAQFLTRVAEGWPQIMRLLLTGYAEMDAAIEAINNGHIYGYYSKPWEDTELRLGVENALKQKHLAEERDKLLKELALRNNELKALNNDLDAKVQVRTAQLQTALGEIRNANQDLKRHYSDTVRAFSRFVDMREDRSTGHARRVAERARKLAAEMGMEAGDQQAIVFAALLLQVGKLTLPDKLISRPLNALFKKEREAFLRHAAVGASILKDIAPLKEASRLIAMQYECHDGSGTPNGLMGEEIPLGARILSVVRDYDLLMEGVITGKLMTASEAQDQLRRLRGKKYDPAVVDAIIELVGEVKDSVYRPVVKASPLDLVPGMEVVEITYGGEVFLRDVILSKAMIEEIQALQTDVDSAIDIQIRARK